MSLLEENSW